MNEPRYHFKVFRSDDDGLWIADVPDLKDCSSHGATPEKAIANIQEAIEGWLETARETGLEIPKPRYRPAAA
ncbi:MAG TPA: type II toxin-antitoxin system HicB family antitoxin [Sphingomicrobium sp.]|nr:type II toxin-antitoxin system HicB family antitoxin [Sphingomicrobium sp.]